MSLAGRTSTIPSRAERSSAPLSSAQEGLWFLDQWGPGHPRYNVPLVVRIQGPLRVDALARAVAQVVRRHDILRTTFAAEQGEPRQRVSAVPSVSLRMVDASGLPPAAGEGAVRRLLGREVWQPFDLALGPLLRVTLWRMSREAHLLSATLHHIIGDAASVNVLLREVGAIYEALVAERPSPLAPLAIQYGDYAAWERTRLDGPALERGLAYWETQLAGAGPLDLPVDRARPAVRTFAGGSEPWSLSREVTAGVRELARTERVTLFMLLLAAFAALLRRHTHQDDVAIGSPMTVRPSRETEPLVGLFLNTLVFRLKAEAGLPFTRLLAHARAVVLGAFAQRDVPFGRVVERLQPARRDDTPLFNVRLAIQPAPWAEGGLNGLQTTPVPMADEAIRYDLTLYVREEGDALSGILSYSKELFAPATMARMSGHFARLLQAIVEQPSARLYDLPILAASEREEVLARGRGRLEPPPAAEGVHRLFERHAAKAPEAPAVVRDGVVLSYREIDENANRIAHALLACGAGRGGRVALCLDRRPPLVQALLGTLKAGACYVPLDPTYPVTRLQQIVEDARPAVLLTETRYAPLWQDLAGVKVVCLDADEGLVSGRPTTDPARTITPDDPVYVIYTSGSTGTPKGVVVPHRALINSNIGWIEAIGLTSADRFLHFAPIGFDVSAFQIFSTLMTGATVVLADPAGEMTNDDVLELCERAGITVLDLPSAMWQQWVNDLSERGRRLPASLRVFMTGGEATPMDCVRRWAAMVDGSVRFLSSYGPTETTVTTMWCGQAREVPVWSTPVVTLGQPLPNVTVRVLDEALQPVPAGVTGELCVAGRGLAQAYVGRPDLTADRFVPDPLGDTPGGRLYRTGDRVRYREDGTLEFLGRFDQQLKLHGVRIEAGEIEAHLRRHPLVRAAVVTTVRRPAPVLVAYVVTANPAPAESDLRQHLAAHVPATVLPSAFVFLAALPLTPNGKVDYRALPPPRPDEAERALVEPRTETERLLVELWTSALGRAVGVEDDFFALGGHSLAAARLAARLRETFGVELPVRAVFEAPTVAGLARLIDARRRALAQDEGPPLVKVPRNGPMPVSFAQRGFWLLDQLEPGNATYANAEVVRMRGPFSARAFAQALSQTVARHEVLRTTFAAVAGEPRQIIGPARPVEVPVVDLEALPLPRRDAAASALARAEARAPFDLTRGPLLRATALRLDPDDHVVLFTMHHMISDLWSVGVLMGELSAGYRAAREGVAAELPELPVQYADYAAWERELWTSETLDRAVARRRAQIGAVSAVELPTDHPRPLSPRFVGASQPIPLSEAFLARARQAGQREGVTPFMSMLAVLQTLMHLYTGEESILVAVPVANRGEPALAGLMGYFVNHVVVATRFDGDPTCREILARVRTAALDALDQQDLPFEEFVRRVRPERQGSHTPLHRVLFNLVNVPGMRLDLGDVIAEVAPPAELQTAKYELQWAFADTGDALTGVLGYDRELFEEATASRMAADFARLAEAFIDTPDRKLATLKLMTATQESLALAFNEPL